MAGIGSISKLVRKGIGEITSEAEGLIAKASPALRKQAEEEILLTGSLSESLLDKLRKTSGAKEQTLPAGVTAPDTAKTKTVDREALFREQQFRKQGKEEAAAQRKRAEEIERQKNLPAVFDKELASKASGNFERQLRYLQANKIVPEETVSAIKKRFDKFNRDAWEVSQGWKPGSVPKESFLTVNVDELSGPAKRKVLQLRKEWADQTAAASKKLEKTKQIAQQARKEKNKEDFLNREIDKLIDEPKNELDAAVNATLKRLKMGAIAAGVAGGTIGIASALGKMEETADALNNTITSTPQPEPIAGEEGQPVAEERPEEETPSAVTELQEQLKASQEKAAALQSQMDAIPDAILSAAEKKEIEDKKKRIAENFRELREDLKSRKNRTALLGLVNVLTQASIQLAAAQRGLATGQDLSSVRTNRNNFMDRINTLDDQLLRLKEKENVSLEDVEDLRQEMLKGKQKVRGEAVERLEKRAKEERDFARDVELERIKTRNRAMLEELKKEGKTDKEIKQQEDNFNQAADALMDVQAKNFEEGKTSPTQSSLNKITKGFGVSLDELGKIAHEIKGEDPEDYDNYLQALDGLDRKQALQIIERLRTKPEAKQTTGSTMVKMINPKDGKPYMIPSDKVKLAEEKGWTRG